MKCIYCGEVLANNDHATRHAGECPVMNSEPAWWVLWVKSAQHRIHLTALWVGSVCLFFGVGIGMILVNAVNCGR